MNKKINIKIKNSYLLAILNDMDTFMYSLKGFRNCLNFFISTKGLVDIKFNKKSITFTYYESCTDSYTINNLKQGIDNCLNYQGLSFIHDSIKGDIEELSLFEDYVQINMYGEYSLR